MRTTWQVISLMAVLHMMVLLGLVGWLGATGRLNTERMKEVKNVFAMTVEQEKEADAQAKATEEQVKAEEERAKRALGEGPESTLEQLAAQDDAAAMERRELERTKQEIMDLRRNLELAQGLLERRNQDLMAALDAKQKELDALEKVKDDAGFKKTVELVEGMPAAQAKQMFLNMMGSGGMDQVVSYLESMQPRKATAVLREFKTSQEVAAVVELMERLRARGSELGQSLEQVS